MSTATLIAPLDVSAQQRQLVLETLRCVLESTNFCKSKRYPAFLDFAVRHALQGSSAPLKERTVGVEVFGRPLDYDTGSDAVVRVASGEVRKRLAAYFSEHPDSPVRIEIPAGSYHVEFHFRPEPAGERPRQERSEAPFINEWPVEDSPVQPNGTDRLTRHPKLASPILPLWKVRTLIAFAGILAVALSAFAWQSVHHLSVEHEFWQPVLGNERAAMILVGKVARNPTGANPSQASAATLTAGTQSDLALEDAVVMAQICNVFLKYRLDCKIESGKTEKAEDLYDKSVVLVGGLNNPWTLRALSRLPYQFQTSGDPGQSSAPLQRTVIERKQSGDAVLGTVVSEDEGSSDSEDYAIVARIHSEFTEKPMVILAGLGRAGTASAGGYVNSKERWNELLARAPRGWDGKNMEAVLKTEVVQGSPVTVKVIAARFW